ncbi:hypothetical protein PVL29_002519 [Vitis rotundifolia]|uniref:Uncharacterized protein n=1 Tax=Vitis rotundifolia TaxID=103349 RepID=A0AA39E2V5_VITRO|nr:hypothetical protein PVL29_002519 [Vitis rotundifolia]
MENYSKGILELFRVSLWRLISRREVHLVKYPVLPLSQLTKTFRDAAYGHFGELKLTTFPSRSFSHSSGRKSNTSSFFCKRTIRLSKHWVKEFAKACAELAELWATLGVHGHVLKHGWESIAEVETELMIIYVKFVELSYVEFLFGKHPRC